MDKDVITIKQIKEQLKPTDLGLPAIPVQRTVKNQLSTASLPEVCILQKVDTKPYKITNPDNGNVKEYECINIINPDTGTKSSIWFDPEDKFETVKEEVKESLLKALKAKSLSKLTTCPSWTKTRTIGADPEVFVTDNKDGLIPSFLFLPDSTNKMTCIGHENRQGAGVYNDGFQAEFNSKATHCNEIHTDSLHLGLKTIYQAAIKHNPNAKLSIINTLDVDAELLQSTDPKYVQFGCKPSFNIYGLTTPPLRGEEVTCRSAGGHIHFGFGKQPDDVIDRVVRLLDAILGVACVSLFEKLDQPKRRIYYGLAGEFRLPEHGLEWRTLSNAWLCHPCITHLVIDVARAVTVMAMDGLSEFWDASEEEVVKTINNCDVDSARSILSRNEKVFKNILNACYASQNIANVAYDTFMKGVEHIVQDPTNLTKNWCLSDEYTWGFGGGEYKWARTAGFKFQNQALKV